MDKINDVQVTLVGPYSETTLWPIHNFELIKDYLLFDAKI